MHPAMMQYKKTSHILHLILTVLFFPWIVVWVVCTLSNNAHNDKVDMMFAIQHNAAQQANKSHTHTH